MFKSDSIGQIAKALAIFQSKKITIPKGESVKDYKGDIKYTYAKIESIIDSIEPHLANCGLAISQFTGGDTGKVKITTILMHAESGEYMGEENSEDVVVPLNKDGRPSQTKEQTYGSIATYYRKYGITSILGIATTDDEILDPDDRNDEYQRPENPQLEYMTPLSVPVITEEQKNDLLIKVIAYNLEEGEPQNIINRALNYYKIDNLENLSGVQLKSILKRIDSSEKGVDK